MKCKILLVITFIVASCTNTQDGVAEVRHFAADAPKAVIFEGSTICDGCQTPFEDWFESRGYQVVAVKPGQSTPATLAGAKIYIVPGGEDVTSLDEGWTDSDRQAIRDYINNGGRYYGVCLGGYWAGRAGTWAGTVPGFKALEIIPAEVVAQSPADKSDKVVNVSWEGMPRDVFFQDGPAFTITDPTQVLKVYATYDGQNQVAAFLSRFGRGKVAITGVHLEATKEWYDASHLKMPDKPTVDMMDEMMSDLFK